MERFSQFTRERQYLHNVSFSTLEWYKNSLKWLPSESPSQDELKAAVIRMRQKGLKATGCNSVIRAVNAYLKWSGSTLKIPSLKEPQLILPTFTTTQVSWLVSWKPALDDAIDELNIRFREQGVGYQYESGEIIKVDSQLIHAEVVKPVLALLADEEYAGANAEF